MSLENSIDNFLKEQSQQTEVKTVNSTPAAAAPTNVSEPAEIPVPNDDDFIKPPPVEVKNDELVAQVKEIAPIDPRKEAKNYTVMVDMTQKLLFTGLQKRKAVNKIGGKENWNKAVNLQDDVSLGDINIKELTAEEKKAYNLVERTKKKIARLSLTEEEKDVWMDALEGFVSENGYKMPPSVLLIIALINTLAPRVTDLMID